MQLTALLDVLVSNLFESLVRHEVWAEGALKVIKQELAFLVPMLPNQEFWVDRKSVFEHWFEILRLIVEFSQLWVYSKGQNTFYESSCNYQVVLVLLMQRFYSLNNIWDAANIYWGLKECTCVQKDRLCLVKNELITLLTYTLLIKCRHHLLNYYSLMFIYLKG